MVVQSAACMGQKDPLDKVLGRLSPGELYRIESRRFVLWLPVFLGIGIWIYFDLDREPAQSLALVILGPFVLIASGIARRIGWAALATAWAAFAVSLGFGAAMWSAHRAEAPAIKFPMGETVEGRVLELSRSASGAPRMLLDRVVVFGAEPGRTPDRLRLTVLDPVPEVLPIPGQYIRVYASLMPNGEPVEPGAFDFQRRAFFERLGGVGLTRGHVAILPASASIGYWDTARIWLAVLRDRISRALRTTLPGRQGAFAAAIIVGDRADIEETDAEALRASNLAHLLAISGLHMGILTGLVFAVVRLIMAIFPCISDRISSKKVAAIAALLAGVSYLALSGATVATQRAFIMVAVAFCAVLVDRPAITLRALAIAAAIILLIRPISLMDAGFQMSFAATVALVAGYDATRRLFPVDRRQRSWPIVVLRGIVFYVGALLFSSLLAGLATAPIAAYHFNRTAPYGLLSNLLALPIMGFWIAPAACIAAVLAPFGLSEIALRAMGQGIDRVLDVAHWVANLPGSVQPVQVADGVVLGMITLGGLWLALWQGRWRFAGPIAIIAGLVVWAYPPPRPDVLLSKDARLVGVMTSEGRVLDHDRAQSFAAKTWLRRDGDSANQLAAATRQGLNREKGWFGAELRDGWRLEFFWAEPASGVRLDAFCRPRTLIVVRNGPAPDGPCIAIGKNELRRTGAVSVTISGDTAIVTGSRNPQRKRLWDR